VIQDWESNKPLEMLVCIRQNTLEKSWQLFNHLSNQEKTNSLQFSSKCYQHGFMNMHFAPIYHVTSSSLNTVWHCLKNIKYLDEKISFFRYDWRLTSALFKHCIIADCVINFILYKLIHLDFKTECIYQSYS